MSKNSKKDTEQCAIPVVNGWHLFDLENFDEIPKKMDRKLKLNMVIKQLLIWYGICMKLLDRNLCIWYDGELAVNVLPALRSLPK